MSGPLPAVTTGDGFVDQQWFSDHPGRRYHRRPGPDGAVWLIRRRGRDIYLRTLWTPPFAYPDNDEALRQAWFAAAWPELDPLERDDLIKEARKAERTGGRLAARTPSYPSRGQT